MKATRSRGVALLTVTMLLILFVLATFGLITFSLQDRRAATEQIRAMQAAYLADSGIAYAAFLFRTDRPETEKTAQDQIDNGGNDDPWDFMSKTAHKITPAQSGMNFGLPGTFGQFEIKSFEFNPNDPDTPGIFPETVRVRSIGQLIEGDPNASPLTWRIVARRTTYAKISLGDCQTPPTIQNAEFGPVLSHGKYKK